MDYLKETDIMEAVRPYDMTLFMRSGNNSVPKEAYNYMFYDDMNINIEIDPTDGSFTFSYLVESIYQFTSGKAAPVTREDHFGHMYKRFRETVSKIKTVCR